MEIRFIENRISNLLTQHLQVPCKLLTNFAIVWWYQFVSRMKQGYYYEGKSKKCQKLSANQNIFNVKKEIDFFRCKVHLIFCRFLFILNFVDFNSKQILFVSFWEKLATNLSRIFMIVKYIAMHYLLHIFISIAFF